MVFSGCAEVYRQEGLGWRVLTLEELSVCGGPKRQWHQGAAGTEEEERESKLRPGALM